MDKKYKIKLDIRIKQTSASIQHKILIPRKVQKKNVLEVEANLKDYGGSLNTNNGN